jgi:hypothetical protein
VVGDGGFTHADAPIVSVAVGNSLADLTPHGSWNTATLASQQHPHPNPEHAVAPLSTLVCVLPNAPPCRVVTVRLELPASASSASSAAAALVSTSELEPSPDCAVSSADGEPLHLHLLRLEVVGSAVDDTEGPWQADKEKYSERLALARAMDTHPAVRAPTSQRLP